MKKSGLSLLGTTVCVFASAHAASSAPASRPVPPLAPQTGFELYLQASKLIETAQPNVDPIDDATPPASPKERAQRYSLARREAWLKKNAAGFALFQKVLKMPVKHPPLLNQDEVVKNFPDYASLRQLARDKGIERNTRELRGDWNGAMQSRIDSVQMGTDIGRGGMLIASLVSVAIQAIGRNEPWEATEHLNASQARAAAQRLETIYGRRVRLAEALEGEKQFGLTQIHELTRTPDWRNPKKWDDLRPEQRLQILTITPAEMKRTFTFSMNRQIELARLPYTASRPQRKEDPNTLDYILTPDWSRTNHNFARNDASNAVWLVALALRAHKLERGAYPENLRALVPGFLQRVPLDPFGGVEALRYKLSGNTYVLWSIGPDGVNNGGRPIKWSKPRKTIAGQAPRLPFIDVESKGDYVAGKNR